MKFRFSWSGLESPRAFFALCQWILTSWRLGWKAQSEGEDWHWYLYLSDRFTSWISTMPSETLSDISELWLDECFEHAHLLHHSDALCVGSLVGKDTKYRTSPAGLPEFMSWLSRANLVSLSCPSFRELIFPFSSSVILYACIVCSTFHWNLSQTS